MKMFGFWRKSSVIQLAYINPIAPYAGYPLILHDHTHVSQTHVLRHLEQFCRIAGMQTDASRRRWLAQFADLIGAVDGIIAPKKDRMRHRRIVIQARFVMT